ncbi:hypothetical protein [Orbus mooreae]|uniref:hypothetical protein n=1 Tax=Orbus mooreae TaxID=3074107 RepID=UPI00370DB915
MKIRHYNISPYDAKCIGLPFHGEFYRSQDVEKKVATFEAKILQLKTKLENKKATNELTVRGFREYLLSGGYSNHNVRIYILNLIDAYMLQRSN